MGRYASHDYYNKGGTALRWWFEKAKGSEKARVPKRPEGESRDRSKFFKLVTVSEAEPLLVPLH